MVIKQVKGRRGSGLFQKARVLRHYSQLQHEVSPSRKVDQKPVDPPFSRPFETFSIPEGIVFQGLIKRKIDVMRLTFATTFLDNGNDLRIVRALMGHSHIRTTERYLPSTDDRKVEAILSLQFGV